MGRNWVDVLKVKGTAWGMQGNSIYSLLEKGGREIANKYWF
jgi:hypothetical protein